MFKCIIIDRDFESANHLAECLNAFGTFQVSEIFYDREAALTGVLVGPTIDFIFLDIEMVIFPDLDHAHQIRSKANTMIICTANPDLGYQAFEAGADGFLLKPFTLARLAQVLTRVFPDTDQAANHPDHFFLKDIDDGIIRKVRFVDILYLEDHASNVRIHYLRTRTTVRIGLKEVAEALAFLGFLIPLSVGHIVSKKHIKAIHNDQVEMENGDKITVSSSYYKILADLIREKSI